jgi:hypothetical protein
VPDRQFYDSRPIDVVGEGGQLYWGHAYFVAREMAFPPDQLPHGVRDAVAVAAFGFDDLAESLLARA